MPVTSQLEETGECYKTLIEPIFAEDTPYVPEQTTEDLQTLVIRDEELGEAAEKELDKMNSQNGWPRIVWQCILQ